MFVFRLFPFDHLPFEIEKTFPGDPSLLCPHQIIMCVRCVQLRPNKRYILDDFIVMPWTFDVIVSAEIWAQTMFMKPVMRIFVIFITALSIWFTTMRPSPECFESRQDSSDKKDQLNFIESHLWGNNSRPAVNCNDIAFYCCFSTVIKTQFFMGKKFYDSSFH